VGLNGVTPMLGNLDSFLLVNPIGWGKRSESTLGMKYINQAGETSSKRGGGASL